MLAPYSADRTPRPGLRDNRGTNGCLVSFIPDTNANQSMISIPRTTARKQKRSRDVEMKNRWVAAGTLEAERSFHRVKAHRDLSKLLAALRARRVGADPAKAYTQATA